MQSSSNNFVSHYPGHHHHQADLAEAGEAEVDALALGEGMAGVGADSSLPVTFAVESKYC